MYHGLILLQVTKTVTKVRLLFILETATVVPSALITIYAQTPVQMTLGVPSQADSRVGLTVSVSPTLSMSIIVQETDQ